MGAVGRRRTARTISSEVVRNIPVHRPHHVTAVPSTLREIDTPYTTLGAATSVATPSCCSCCCCCVTALTVAPAYISFDTYSVALQNGRDGTWPGLMALVALGVPAALVIPALIVTEHWLAVVVWLMFTVGFVTGARRLAGESTERALTWGARATVAWALLLALNLVIDVPLWLGTYGVGAVIELALIPFWIVRVERRIRRKRNAALASQRPRRTSIIDRGDDTASTISPPATTDPPVPQDPDDPGSRPPNVP